LPNYVRMVVDDHMLNYPGSDLMDVLTGKKPFQDALDSPPKIEVKRAKASWAWRREDVS